MKNYHTSLKTNWKSPFGFGKVATVGVQRPVSRLAASQPKYTPAGITPKVACVKRVKGGFKVVGILEIIKGSFADVKKFLREQGFAAAKMGAVRAML